MDAKKREKVKEMFFSWYIAQYPKEDIEAFEDIKDFNEEIKVYRQLFDEIEDEKLEKLPSPFIRVIDENLLFGDISTTIKILSDYQKEGFMELVQVWEGYEDNHFEVRKPALECDEELYQRIKLILDHKYYWWGKKQDTIRLKKEKIRQMEQELEKLKADYEEYKV